MKKTEVRLFFDRPFVCERNHHNDNPLKIIHCILINAGKKNNLHRSNSVVAYSQSKHRDRNNATERDSFSFLGGVTRRQTKHWELLSRLNAIPSQILRHLLQPSYAKTVCAVECILITIWRTDQHATFRLSSEAGSRNTEYIALQTLQRLKMLR